MASVGPEAGRLPDETAAQPERRVVHLEVIAHSPADQNASLTVPASAARMAGGPPWTELATRDGWLCLAERTVGDWASTLRGAFLMLFAFAGLIVLIGVAFGFGGVVLGALLAAAGLLLRGPLNRVLGSA